MNYGYDATCVGYRPARKRKLARRLLDLVKRPEYQSRFGSWPYVEVDGLYKGVRIRHITHLDREAQLALAAAADAIFLEVMAE